MDARIHDEPHLWRPHESQFLIEVTIADTGCGIEGIRLESIFRELEQFEHSSSNGNSEHNATGLGLGLAVVARAINQIGGQLRVDSAPGQGSKFLCLIPFEMDSESLTFWCKVRYTDDCCRTSITWNDFCDMASLSDAAHNRFWDFGVEARAFELGYTDNAAKNIRGCHACYSHDLAILIFVHLYRVIHRSIYVEYTVVLRSIFK